MVAFSVVVLAGCSDGPETDSVVVLDGPLQAYRDGVDVPVPSPLAEMAAVVFPTGFHRGEPTVGLTSDGVLFTTAALELPENPPGTQGGLIARSTDGGKTWAIVQDVLLNGKADVDPWLWVDPATDRVFNAPLYAACSWLAWSDDRGDTWDANPLAGCGFPGHDHQKLTGGPPPTGVTTNGYPSLLYYAYNSVRPDEGTMVSVSRDGGRTFALPVQAHPKDPCHTGINGPVAVAMDGAAYVPKPTCEGVAIATSTDGGTSWGTPVDIHGAGMAAHLVTLHAAVDAAGTVYVAWTGADERLYIAHSYDQATTWSEPLVVSAPAIKAVVFSALVAGGPGRIGLLYVATEDDPAAWSAMDPSVAPDTTVWHAYLAETVDATSAAPTFVMQRLTTDQDPAQRGCIWLSGGSNPCRNLRDFIDVQVGQDGRLVGAYSDGCEACSSAAQRNALGETVVVVQQAGPSLLDGAPMGPLRGTVPN